MRHTTLGTTGLKVSALCYGTMSFGGDADETTSAKLFAACREAGINFFDCANIYSAGKAEETLGRLMRGCRDELVITSKVAMQTPGQDRGRDLSRTTIVRCVEASLKRLGTDRLDVYFCHHSDPVTPIAETLAAMEELIRSGKVRHLGVSNWEAWRIGLALGLAEGADLARIEVLQPMYNLLKRTAEIEILPLAAERNLGVIPYSPLGGGLLTGKYLRDEKATGRLTQSAMYAKRYDRQATAETVGRLCAIAERVGVHPATLAVAWVAANPAVTAPILGARNLDQLAPSLAAGSFEMTAELYKEITDLTAPVPNATDRTEEQAE